MNVHKITLEEWAYRREQIPMSVATSPEFILSFSQNHEVEYSIYSVEHNNKVQIAMVIFHKGKDAKVFTHFFNNPFYVNPLLTSGEIFEAMEYLLAELKKDFYAFDLKLNESYVNLVLYKKWKFSVKRYQTYIIDLAKDLKYSMNIRRMLKKATLEGYTVRQIENKSEIIHLQVHYMLEKGIPVKHAQPITHWIQTLDEMGAIKAFVLYDAQRQMQGSCLMIDDQSLKSAYLLGIFSNQGAGQSPLYDAFINYFKAKEYSIIDLWGGNIPKVAQFKAKWDSDLAYYYMVSYRKYPYVAQNLEFLKTITKTLLRRA